MPSVCNAINPEGKVEQRWRRAHGAGATLAPPARGLVGRSATGEGCGAAQGAYRWYP